MIDLQVREPDFVTETGVKLWLDESSTRYAQKSKYSFGSSPQKGLKDHKVFIAHHPDGSKCFAVMKPNREKTHMEVIKECTSLSDLGFWIDLAKGLQNMDKIAKRKARAK